MSKEILIPSKEDYVKFKKFLRFFVRQANENEKNNEPEAKSHIKIDYKTSVSDKQKFIKYYNGKYNYDLKDGFNEMIDGKLNFQIRFYTLEDYENKRYNHNTEFSTYINIGLFNIIAKFENKRITALQNKIRLEIRTLKITGETSVACEKLNEILKPYSIEDLGIDNDNNPSDLLKKMFNEYLCVYNLFHEFVEHSTVKK